MPPTKPKYYLTTPIYYTNGSPHIGHTYSTIVCDAIRRYKRMLGYEVVLTTGTDEHGVNVERSAKKAGTRPTGHAFALPNEYGEAPMNLVIGGGKASIDQMVAGTDRGLLVTRLWYIRELDPYEKVMTGMTRDGLFLVEKGKVSRSVRNFRFNQSVLQMLRNVEALGPARRATAEESFEMVVPPMKINDFHFSEVTKF